MIIWVKIQGGAWPAGHLKQHHLTWTGDKTGPSPAGGDSPADLVVIKLICSSWWKLGLVLMKSGHKKLSCRDKLN